MALGVGFCYTLSHSERPAAKEERHMHHATPKSNANACTTVRVVYKNPLGSTNPTQFLLGLQSPGWDYAPGQFVMVRPVSWGFDPVWGRPFSIAHMDGEHLTLLIRKVGRGTEGIGRLKPGNEVTVWGPLGNGFTMDETTPTLIIAGGIGLAPFIGYSIEHPAPQNVRMLFGHRLDVSNYPIDVFGRLAEGEHFEEKTPEDIPRFVELVEERMTTLANESTQGRVLACGPTPLLATVQRVAQRLGIAARTELSLENRMACGVGACLGCVQPDASGHHVKTCTEGPVFTADAITLG